jgi:hypothetical protein
VSYSYFKVAKNRTLHAPAVYSYIRSSPLTLSCVLPFVTTVVTSEGVPQESRATERRCCSLDGDHQVRHPPAPGGRGCGP